MIIKKLFSLLLPTILLFWSYQKGLWNLRFLTEHQHPYFLVIFSLLLMIFTLTIQAFRWKTILRLLEAEATSEVKPYIHIVFISTFFNCFVPGSVAGDLLRFKYKHVLGTHLKTSSILWSSVCDRIFGLVVWTFQGGLLSMLIWQQRHAFSPLVTLIITFMPLGILPFLFLLIILYTPIFKRLKFFSLLLKIKPAFLTNLFYTLLMQQIILGLFLYWTKAQWHLLSESINILCAVTTGLVLSAIPIAPAGAGVGHLLFDHLFTGMHLVRGANYFHLYFLLTLGTALLGAFSYYKLTFIKAQK
jgi:hypothetical protein